MHDVDGSVQVIPHMRTERVSSNAVDPGLVNYVYICGSGHSGSTLLEMFLACHSQMVAVGELQNLSHQIAIGRVCSCGRLPRECTRWQAVRDAVLEQNGIDIFAQPHDFVVSKERPRDAFESLSRLRSRFWSYSSFTIPILGSLGLHHLLVGRRRALSNTAFVADIVRQNSGARIVIDSSKDYLRMREIYHFAPVGSMKVIYLGRDGRGCLWSALKRNQASPAKASREWAKNQQRTRRMLRSVRPQDQLFIRYEDLCADMESTLQQICTFIGVSYERQMLDLSPEQHHTIAGNKIRVSRAMEVRVDTAWRDNLTPVQLRTFEKNAGSENRRLGYE